MTEWEGKTRGGVSGYKFFVFLIKKLGVSSAYFFLKIVAAYFLFASRKTNRTIYFYFKEIHKYGKLKSLYSIYLNYCMLGKTLVDKVAWQSGADSSYNTNFTKEPYLRKFIEEKSGGIIINAHIGNWEVAGKVLEQIDVPVNIVMFDAEHERIKQYLSNVLQNKNLKIILIKNDYTHLEQIREALVNKEIVAMNGDRFVEGNRTATCSFLGRSADFPVSPFYIAGKFNVPIMYGFAMKEGKKFYRIIASEKKWVSGFGSMGTRDKGLIDAVNDYVKELEKVVRQYPLQWFNYYNFWRTAT